MKIEVGKKYLDRQGAVIEIIRHEPERSYPFIGIDVEQTARAYTESGRFFSPPDLDSEYDSVSEFCAGLTGHVGPTGVSGPAGVPTPLSPLPQDSAARKDVPVWEGFIAYAPAAIAAAARISVIGNKKHNPGEELHHARGKSMDHTNCHARHLMDFQAIEAYVKRDLGGDWGKCPKDLFAAAEDHIGNMVWRSTMFGQEKLEEMGLAPLAPRARITTTKETNQK